MISTIMTVLGFGGNDTELQGSDAIVTEFYEVTDAPEDTKLTQGTLDRVERLADEGFFHTFSEAKLVFDLGEYGEYPVNLQLPRFPDEENELQCFLDRLGYEVADLPALEDGSVTFPFERIDGEWSIDWDNWDQ